MFLWKQIKMDFKRNDFFVKSLENFENFEKKEKKDCDDQLEDIEDTLSGQMVTLAIRPPVLRGEALSERTAIDLKELIIGSAFMAFPDEWRHQYFHFNPKIFYGLIQLKGGPCGLLASLQAYILREVFFGNPETEMTSQLAIGVSKLLWKIGEKKKVFVFHESQSVVMERNIDFSFDGITERSLFITFDSLPNLIDHVTTLLNANHVFGCISLLFSCLVTRGCRRVREDFDCEDTSLIGRHFYCGQELVGLVLTGRAVGNVFDGENRNLNLKGIKGKQEFGFLSLHEYYGSVEVGVSLKCPQFPIFVVLSESHFSVLFSKELIQEKKKSFTLFYYDGLANQDQEVELQIGVADTTILPLVASPLEHVIRTKWRNSSIDWIKGERLL